MSKGTIIGIILLAAGIILWIAYGIYLGFEEILDVRVTSQALREV